MVQNRVLGLLIWKNFVLQKRRPIATAIELLLPILFSFLLLVIRIQVEVETKNTTTSWESYRIGSMPEFDAAVVPEDDRYILAYVPDSSTVVKNIMEKAMKRLNTGRKTELETTCDFERSKLLEAVESWVPAPGVPPPAYLQGLVDTTVVTTGPTSPLFQAAIIQSLNKTANCILNETLRTTDFGQTGRQMAGRQDAGLAVLRIRLIALLNGLARIPTVDIMGFSDESTFTKYYEEEENEHQVLAGVVFSEGFNASSDEVTITLRFSGDPINKNPNISDRFGAVRDTWRTNILYPTILLPGPRANKSRYGGRPRYYEEGFLSLMHAVDLGIAETLSGSNITDDYLSLQRFPYPPYTDDPFIIAIQRTLPLIIMLSFFYTLTVIVKSVVYEKELRMKEYMKMVGLSGWIHWLAWFLKYMVFLTISCIVVAILCKIQTSGGSVLRESDFSLFLVFLLLFSSATITFGFLISTMFDKASSAAAVGGILYGLTYFPAFFMADRLERIGTGTRILLCIFSNLAMANGCDLYSGYEGRGEGLKWSNFHLPINVDQGFTFLHVLLMLMTDTIVYMALTIYIEQVRPGKYGTPLPWYFPFQGSYWTGRTSTPVDAPTECVSRISTNGAYFEAEPEDANCVVSIRELSKVYYNGNKAKVAVRNLNMNMYEGEITVLLGHNGAGKTTTMSMLTGFTPPTSGDAIVNGYSIRNDVKRVRKSLGLCPQFNILFDVLTVDEHLFFFARLKGLDSAEAVEESKKMMKVLQLEDKSQTQSSMLSGGMKRKLSVGIALSADSKYVILDEPTSGMDPAARRAIWEVLEAYRGKCSILLSTHFMDEADYLGNRIAIMADGTLRCAGSPLFLKNKFGVGYHVVLTKTETCNVQNLKELFKEHVPTAHVERAAGAEVSFVLPFHSSDKFPALFGTLDDQAASLGISGYGATITTMEEVFLQVTERSEDPLDHVTESLLIRKSKVKLVSSSEAADLNVSNSNHSNSNTSEKGREATRENGRGDIEMGNLLDRQKQPQNVLTKDYKYNTGWMLWWQQFRSLFIKHLIHSRRNWKLALSQVLVPIVFVFFSILNAKFPPFEIPNVALGLNLDSYGSTVVLYSRDSSSADTIDLTNRYTQEFDNSLHTAISVQDDIDIEISRRRSELFGAFTRNHLIAARFGSDGDNVTATALYNAKAFHTHATSVRYMDQAFIRHMAGPAHRDFKLNVVNSPLPRSANGRIEEEIFGSLTGFLISFNMILGLSFLSASFVVFLVKERTEKAALMQKLTGVSPILFWGSKFFWDFINFFIPCIIALILFAIASVEEYNAQLGVIFFLFLNYIWASLPLTYLASFIFEDSSTALVRMTIFNVISGLGTVIAIQVLNILDFVDIIDIMRKIFYLLPQFCLGQAFGDLYFNYVLRTACTQNDLAVALCRLQNFTYVEDALDVEEPGIGLTIIYLFSVGCFCWASIVFVEFEGLQLVKRLFLRSSQVHSAAWMNEDEDEDVTAERNRINDLYDFTAKSGYRLIVKDLTKVYQNAVQNKSLVAVDHLCFGVPQAECFGLLGINGAGKTSTFKMLTGDYKATSGTAYLDGFSINTTLRQVQQRLGYCPQFDALIEQMTGEETLYMYARLRGVPEHEIAACVSDLGNILSFSEHMLNPCGTYSGGNKRKLSTAISLVGGPPVVLLDEPSTGMDPGARRSLWDAISDVRKSGKSIVFTSHSMEECEALCTRLAIMVNGKLQCIGNPQHLKSRFGQGYNLEISTYGLEKSPEEIKAEVVRRFPGCKLKEGLSYNICLDIPVKDHQGNELGLAKTFAMMEEFKKDFNLGDYTLTQTTLEQVFLSLVKHQRQEDDHTAVGPRTAQVVA